MNIHFCLFLWQIIRYQIMKQCILSRGGHIEYQSKTKYFSFQIIDTCTCIHILFLQNLNTICSDFWTNFHHNLKNKNNQVIPCGFRSYFQIIKVWYVVIFVTRENLSKKTVFRTNFCVCNRQEFGLYKLN